jgi:hypothetical protein
MALPGQLTYARPEVQAAYAALALDVDRAERAAYRAELAAQQPAEDVEHYKTRLHGAFGSGGALGRLRKAEEGAKAAPEAFAHDLARAKSEVEYWRAKLDAAEARLAATRPPAAEARARADALRAKLDAIEKAAVAA